MPEQISLTGLASLHPLSLEQIQTKEKGRNNLPSVDTLKFLAMHCFPSTYVFKLIRFLQ